TAAARVVEGTEGLRVQFHESMMFVEHGRVPGLGNETHQALLGCGCVRSRDDAKTLNDSEMIGVDRERTAAQGGEVDDGGRNLRADAFELLEPGANLIGAVAVQKVERECAGARGDLLERSFETQGLLLREGDDGDGTFDLRHRGIAD